MSVFKRYIGQDSSEPTDNESVAQPSATPSTPSPAQSPTNMPTGPSSGVASRGLSGATRNILSSDVEIKGTVKFTSDLVVDGRIEGEIFSGGSLTVGENAKLKAEIQTSTVVVYGKVHGNIIASDRVDLKSTAEVVGDIKAKTLSVEPGAIFVGKSTVGSPASANAEKSTTGSTQQKSASTPTKPSGSPVQQATLPGTQS